MSEAGGPLSGIRAVEMAGLGAVPYAGMLLSDLGAEVIRIDRPGAKAEGAERDVLSRGRRSLTINVKNPAGLEILLQLIDRADVLTEGYRPGVAERLGFGPEVCLDRNPRLIYARMTGWGQDGPLAHKAGHDLNYLALTGVLSLMQGERETITPTLPGLIADLAGGGLMLAFGVASALVHRGVSGQGQVIDVPMAEGIASLTSMAFSSVARGYRLDAPGTNYYDGSAPFYGLYSTSDGGQLAVAAVEPQFYSELVRTLGLDSEQLADRDDPANWPSLKSLFASIFASKTCDEWVARFEASDACVTPVLDFDEAVQHPHMTARHSYTEAFGVVQPAPTPRFSATERAVVGPAPRPGEHSREVLMGWGWAPSDADELLSDGIVG